VDYRRRSRNRRIRALKQQFNAVLPATLDKCCYKRYKVARIYANSGVIISMSVDQAFRKMIRREIEVQLRPLQTAVSELQSNAVHLQAFRQIVDTLSPIFGVTQSIPSNRAPYANGTMNGVHPRKRGRRALNSNRECAVQGCGNQSRSKGYCAVHYQKLRNLTRTKRRPTDWKDFASPNTVRDIVLPRGRAAAKLLRRRRK
jgi:hypothetical protein